MLARFQPRHSAQPGDVEQDAAADDAVLDELDPLRRRPCGADAARLHAVVEQALIGDVAQRVDVRVPVAVVVDADEVLGEPDRPEAALVLVLLGHMEVGGGGRVGCRGGA